MVQRDRSGGGLGQGGRHASPAPVRHAVVRCDALVDAVQRASVDGFAGAIVNAGGYTHTSVALRDALVGCSLPFVEVHLSNVHAREEFRHVSLLSDVAVGCVVGLGAGGYGLALRGLVARLSD